jgi:acetyltransferase-like isoleucine patch superfamily enzyme
MFRNIKNKIVQYLFLQFQELYRKKELKELESLKKQFKKVGAGFALGKDYSVLNPHFMQFGDNFMASFRYRIEAISNYQNQIFTPSISIGNNVTFNPDCHVACISKIEIGDNCLFASRVFISDHNHGDTTIKMMNIPPAERPLTSSGSVTIGKNVWVGEGAAILSGVTIGDNAIIATNAVVTKDVPKNAIVGGVPARILKIINEDETNH